MQPLLAAPNDLTVSLIVFLIISLVSWILNLAKSKNAERSRPPAPRPDVLVGGPDGGRRPRSIVLAPMPQSGQTPVYEDLEVVDEESPVGSLSDRHLQSQLEGNHLETRPPSDLSAGLKEQVRAYMGRPGRSRKPQRKPAVSTTQYIPPSRQMGPPPAGGRVVGTSTTGAAAIRAALKNPDAVRQAIVINEILQRPRALRR